MNAAKWVVVVNGEPCKIDWDTEAEAQHDAAGILEVLPTADVAVVPIYEASLEV